MRTHSYFISDLHLGARYITDPRAHEQKIVGWLESIAPTARQIFLLGDILDYWYEYRNVVPRGFIRFFGALARLADSGVEIVWFKGNHDIWLFDYLRNEIGMQIVDGTLIREIDGRTFLMEHGDGVGPIPASYRIMRRTFRNPFAQWLYAAIHPRWTIAFAHGWSRKSRKSQPTPNPVTLANDIKRLQNFAQSVLDSGEIIDYFIFGHLHSPQSISLNNGSAHLEILGECYSQFIFGDWDGQTFSLRKIE